MNEILIYFEKSGKYDCGKLHGVFAPCQQTKNMKTKSFDCVESYRGKCKVGDVELEVISHAHFSGVLHYGIMGVGEGGKSILGWVPVALVEWVLPSHPRYSIHR